MLTRSNWDHPILHILHAVGLCACLLGMTVVARAASQPVPAHSPALTADQIVAKNIKARGGLAAWRGLESMVLYGYVDSGDPASQPTRFVMKLKRPNKKRLDMKIMGGYVMEIYDGQSGWRVRTADNRSRVEPFSKVELQRAAARHDMDAPLLDYSTSGARVQLEGTETVENRKTYRLKLIQGPHERHVWIDAQTFLETRIEEIAATDAKEHPPVNTYFRDFRRVEGLMLPLVEDTVVEGTGTRQHRVVEKVMLNTVSDDGIFADPRIRAAGSSGTTGLGLPVNSQPRPLPDFLKNRAQPESDRDTPPAEH